MSTNPTIAREDHNHCHEALLRLSEALTSWSDPKTFVKTLADQLEELLQFDSLDVLVFGEDLNDIEWHAWGRGPVLADDADVEELSAWQVSDSDQPLHIDDWNSDGRFPRLRETIAGSDVVLNSVVRVPITIRHKRLGTLGLGSRQAASYRPQDIGFLQLIARVAALAIDDGLNLRRAQTAQQCAHRQNDRLQLLLNLTQRITSNLELREVLRAIATNIREVIQCDAVVISLPDMALEKTRLYVLDFPGSKGLIVEDLIVTMSAATKRTLETRKPVISISDADLSPEIRDRVIAEGLKSRCLIPLVNRDRVVGVLSIMRTTETTFPAEDIQFLTQASGQIAIAIENAVAYREILDLKDKLAQEKLYLEEEIRSEMGFEQIIGNGPALKHVLELVNTVAPTDSTVLLLGETGTGKELIARAIHEHSRRKDRTFVKLNCAAIPTGLLESELFGHEKGAFTGAISQKIGRLELADHGTLFLDEVGDIPIEIQPKLLRALQEREFERLGSTHTRKVNVRLIAATNRDLEKMIASREFRSDLYYRLHVFPIRIPPLRERGEDIPQLVSYFVQKFAKQMQKRIDSISPAVMKGLTAWDWPGNIRELENFIERAVIVTRGKSLEAPLGELRKAILDAPTPRTTESRQDIAEIVKETIHAINAKRTVMDDYAKKQREEIVRALTESKGRVGGDDGAAARMGTKRSTLLSRIKKFGIDPKQYA